MPLPAPARTACANLVVVVLSARVWQRLFGGVRRWLGWRKGEVTAALVAVISVAHVISALRPKPSHQVTLYMRRLKQPGSDMLRGSATPQNPFTAEFNTFFTLLIDIVDYAVMKTVGTDCPHLTQQEHWHAKMHHEGQKALYERDKCRRYWPFIKFLDFAMLRSGPTFMAAICGSIESLSSAWLYYSMALPFARDWADNLALFHMMEEVEHSQLTVSILRRKTNLLARILVFPVVARVFLDLGIAIPVIHLASHPAALLRGPRLLIDLVGFYLNITLAGAAGTAQLFWQWILPFEESRAASARRLAYCQALVAARGVEFEVVDQGTYTIAA